MEPIIGVAVAFGFLVVVARSMVGSYKRGEMRFDNIEHVTYEDPDDEMGDYQPRRRRPPRTRERRDYYEDRRDRPRYRDDRYYDDRDDYDHYAGY